MQGLEAILKSFHIETEDVSLYEMAFTHASYTNEHKECQDYDRLEFLGDSLLDMIVGDMVYEYYPDSNSGVLSKTRAVLVEGKTLSSLSEQLGFASLVRYSKGEQNNSKFHKHINEDVFEAFLGALYLDQGYSKVREVIITLFAPLLPGSMERATQRDSKSTLQEILKGQVIDYVVVKQENLNSENVCFTVEARLQGVVLGIGKGHNTKEAEIAAAKSAIDKKVGN